MQDARRAQETHEAFNPPSRTGADAAGPVQAQAAAAEAETESEEETESESDDEIFKRANPELGLRQRAAAPEDPWRPIFIWLVDVVNHRLAAEGQDAVGSRVRALLPASGFTANDLTPEHLCDGKVLCALLMAIQPESLPKANPVALGRIA